MTTPTVEALLDELLAEVLGLWISVHDEHCTNVAHRPGATCHAAPPDCLLRFRKRLKIPWHPEIVNEWLDHKDPA